MRKSRKDLTYEMGNLRKEIGKMESAVRVYEDTIEANENRIAELECTIVAVRRAVGE